MSLNELFTDTDHRNRVQGSSCPLLLIVSASGGTGATTAALTAAEIATAGVGMNKVLLMDAVTYKGGISTFLRMKADAPTFATAMTSDRTERGIIPVDVINTLRSDRVPHVNFDVSLALGAKAAPSINVTNAIRTRFIEQVRKSSNLVIVDCGVPDYRDQGETQLAFIAELMQTPNTQMILLCEPNIVSTLAADNIATALQSSYRISVRTNIMTLVNKMPPYFTRDKHWPGLQEALARFSTPLSPVSLDIPGIMQPSAIGRIPTSQGELSGALAEAMYRLTGYPEFEPFANAISEEARKAGAVTKTEGTSVVSQRDDQQKKPRFGILKR